MFLWLHKVKKKKGNLCAVSEFIKTLNYEKNTNDRNECYHGAWRKFEDANVKST